MPNWRRCLISTEWVKRCRCPEPQNHMLRVKGPRPHKAQLLQLWCGPIRGRRLKRVGGRIHWGPRSMQTPRRTCWQWRPLKSGSGPHKRWGISGRHSAPLPPPPPPLHHRRFHHRCCRFFFFFIATVIISLSHMIINAIPVIIIGSPFALLVTKHHCIMCFSRPLPSRLDHTTSGSYVLFRGSRINKEERNAGWGVRRLWCGVLCWRLSHLKYYGGVACGGQGVCVCVCVCVLGGCSVSIDCRSMALRSNWKANIVQHIPGITSYCSNKYAILQCLFLVRLCCSH